MGRKNKASNNGRLSRIGSYAIASSIKDPSCISCTTFNILAPIYKRLNHEDPSLRESDVKDYWMDRNQRILNWLLCERSSIICLQEFWVGNEELVSIYDKRLGDAGYLNFKLARTNNRGDEYGGILGYHFLVLSRHVQFGHLFAYWDFMTSCYVEDSPFDDPRAANASVFADVFVVLVGIEQEQDVNHKYYMKSKISLNFTGLLTAVHKDYFRVINHRELLFNDFGDRVAQLLHVELNAPFSQNLNCHVHQELLIVNTHLLFPHNSSMCLERLRQVYKILQYVESYQKENKLKPLPILLCGDWNGSKRGHIYKFLRSQGFVSSYDTAHQYTDADAHKWVSHRNHRGNICGVDFIWLLNPNRYRKLLNASWSEAVLGMFKYQLKRASLTEEDAFAFLKADNDSDCITYAGFCEALLQQRIWSASWFEQGVEANDNDAFSTDAEQAIGFSVKNAVLSRQSGVLAGQNDMPSTDHWMTPVARHRSRTPTSGPRPTRNHRGHRIERSLCRGDTSE
ncbi:hypothetical protein SASPL_157853 [Salvia splendens]|uniref:Endonuclease/exonuclease/phosphatase domain-containing protein n=1 Tax=Salvia splendens TaxID=180675 RepID=A0A8X8VU90_SALSN|nr:hypothetical protein SASPL_157853 [Salvia splendens]